MLRCLPIHGDTVMHGKKLAPDGLHGVPTNQQRTSLTDHHCVKHIAAGAILNHQKHKTGLWYAPNKQYANTISMAAVGPGFAHGQKRVNWAATSADLC